MKHPIAFLSLNENSEAKRNKFQAGMRGYALDYYVPSDTNLLCAFRIEGNVFGFKAVNALQLEFGVTD